MLDNYKALESMRDFKVLAASSSVEIGMKIAESLGTKVVKAEIEKRSNGEFDVQIQESIRDSDVFIVQSTLPNPNDALMELLIIADAIHRASARRIIACIPCLAYARQDKKELSRIPISGKVIANMIEASGIDRLITLDLHSWQMEGFFTIPVDNILLDSIITKSLKKIPVDDEKMVVVSPGVSSVARCKRFTDTLGVELVLIHFGAIESGGIKATNAISESDMKIVGSVDGKIALIVDDILDSCEMYKYMAKALKTSGAKKVLLVGVHGFFSGDSLDVVDATAEISDVLVSNSIKTCMNGHGSKLTVLDCSPLFAEVIRKIEFSEHF